MDFNSPITKKRGDELKHNVDEAVRMTTESSAFADATKMPPVDIEFNDLTYTVPSGRKGTGYGEFNYSFFAKFKLSYYFWIITLYSLILFFILSYPLYSSLIYSLFIT